MFHSAATPASSLRHSAGFTLIEAMATLAVVATLATVGLPAMNGFLLDARRVAAGNDLVSALNYARGEAVLSRAPVTVCRSDNAQAANPGCGRGEGWESGWIAFIDRDGDGEHDPGEEVLRQHEPLPGGTTLKGNSKVSARVTFKPSGITSNNGSFALCDARGWGGAARVIVIATSGRVRTTNPAQPVDNPLSSCTPSA